MDAVLTDHGARKVDPGTLTGGAPIVVLAPHPDDESLGCGALLAYAFAHDGAEVICMTDGSASHPGSQDWTGDRLAAQRRRELSSAIAHLGGCDRDITWLGHQDGWLGAQDQNAIAHRIAEICRKCEARYLFAPSAQDHHQDHKTTARIALGVAKMVPGLELFTYPIWSRWDDPDFDLHIADYDPVALYPGPWLAPKRAAIRSHGSQLGQVVGDDPTGFTMSAAFVDAFANQPEIYWRGK